MVVTYSCLTVLVWPPVKVTVGVVPAEKGFPSTSMSEEGRRSISTDVLDPDGFVSV